MSGISNHFLEYQLVASKSQHGNEGTQRTVYMERQWDGWCTTHQQRQSKPQRSTNHGHQQKQSKPQHSTNHGHSTHSPRHTARTTPLPSTPHPDLVTFGIDVSTWFTTDNGKHHDSMQIHDAAQHRCSTCNRDSSWCVEVQRCSRLVGFRVMQVAS